MPKPKRGKRRSPAPLRSTSGAGFEFEDLIGAWLFVKMLGGEPAPAIGGRGIQLQAQVSTLGWRIDDLLLTASLDSKRIGQLAISAKGNVQVNAAGLPADFVARAWEQWRDPASPMRRANDGLALVTRGTHPAFDPTWKEVKEACSGSDVVLAISRIRRNGRQSKIFDSVRAPAGSEGEASDQETVELIRHLNVLPVDFQLDHPEQASQAIAQCRKLLVSQDLTEAQTLWKCLINVATDVRLRRGTLKLEELWSLLRRQFALRDHPDFARDWKTLSDLTTDHKTRIQTELRSGYNIARSDLKAKLEAAVSANLITVVIGESGTGKSSLVKNVLDDWSPIWTQVWLAPDELRTALSAARRATLPLQDELRRILSASTNPKNVLVLDSAEGIDPAEFEVIRTRPVGAAEPVLDRWAAGRVRRRR